MNQLYKKIYAYWENGYIYLAIPLLLGLMFLVSDNIGIFDWKKEIAYFQYIRTCLKSYNELPYFWWCIPENVSWYPAVAHTHNFIGNPETMLFSPFTPLLLYINAIQYIKCLFLIHLLIGIIGIFFLKKQLCWSNVQFRLFISLFLFSPIIIQHIAIGYTPYINLYFFPWFIFFLSKSNRISKCTGLSALLSIVLLQGGAHIFVFLFSILFSYSCITSLIEKRIVPLTDILLITFFVFTLSFVRIYSSVFVYDDFVQNLQYGYSALNFLFWTLIPPVLIYFFELPFVYIEMQRVPSWDGGLFWGISFLLFLKIIFNKKRTYVTNKINMEALLFTSIVLFILSFFSIYEKLVIILQYITNTNFFTSVEKYPFRYMIPAYFTFTIIAVECSESIIFKRHYFLNPRITSIINFFKNPLCISTYIATFLLAIVLFFFKPLYNITIKIINTSYNKLLNSNATFTLNNNLVDLSKKYFDIAYTKYYQSYYAIAFILITLIIIIGLIYLIKNVSILKNSFYFKKELILIIPLFFSFCMWLSLSISNDAILYKDIEKSNKKLTAIINGEKAEIAINSSCLLIIKQNNNEGIRKYEFKDIKAADMKYLSISSNAVFDKNSDYLTVKANNNENIIISFKKEKYWFSIKITIAAWFAFLFFLMVYNYQTIYKIYLWKRIFYNFKGKKF